ncbi:MAG: CoA pyrophosphatase [Bacteriovoracia bacterium]
MQIASRSAAVLVPIFDEQRTKQTKYFFDQTHPLSSDASILLTVRTHTVEHHKGQISFPGGVRDSTDVDLLQTALRETFEEVGIPPEHVSIIGDLPEIPTFQSQFIVKPYVGMVSTTPDQLIASEHEIDKLLHVPLSHLLDHTNSKVEELERNKMKFKLRAYYFDHGQRYKIWGATAAMLELFLKRVSIK